MQPRSVTIATVQLWSDRDHSPDDNRRHALEMLEKAAAEQPDLVVMPEAVSMLCYPDDRKDFTYFDVAEPVPGPTSNAACQIAAEHGVNVVIGLIERRESGGQNLALVIDRAGGVVGRYEKIHEPEICRREQFALVGNSIPVFDLDFGRIGIFVCWDLNYPEMTTVLALKGADLLIFPHMISLAKSNSFPLQLRARAIDTGLPIVVAGMRDPHNHNACRDGISPTCVLADDGSVIGSTEIAGPDIVSVTVNLDSDSMNRRRVRRARADVRPDLFASEFRGLNDRLT